MDGIRYYRDKDVPCFELKLCSTTELSYKKHAHEEYSLGIVEQGRSRSWFEGKVKETYPKTMVFLPPGFIHACNPSSKAVWKYKMLFINTVWIGSIIKSKNSSLVNSPVVRDVSARGKFQSVKRLMENLMGNAAPLEKESNLLAVFEQALAGEKLYDLDSRKEQPKVKIIREYLHSCFGEKVTLEQLERVSGLNKFNIIHLFKDAYKIPPHTYQTLLRVNYAQKALRKQRPLTEVALESGFYDQSHFSKVFKNYTGITPERYQKFI